MFVKRSTIVSVSCYRVLEDTYLISFTRWYDPQVRDESVHTRDFVTNTDGARRFVKVVKNLPTKRIQFFSPTVRGWNVRLHPEMERVSLPAAQGA